LKNWSLRDIALIEPEPKDWAWWVSYLLEQLEAEAQNRGKQAKFEELLRELIIGYPELFPDTK
jgi:hypothetical protein